MHPIQPPVKAINPGQLKCILHDLTKHHSQTSIRLEVNGEILSEHFSSVLVFEEHALLLTHLPTRSVFNIPNLDEVTAFMIDKPYQLLMPFQRYMVRTTSVTKKSRTSWITIC